ncbi:hypothetical protein [Vibrio tetraodonis]|uniref:hypothetical protein n=1 Tax=Vibrio tetraodonis TaxID=2231647 RepID=UPI000E0BC00D|nr:hypothetical protein [Vibrio tetraodonis]
MSKKKLTEKELLEGITPYNAHTDLIAKSETKLDWVSFADGVERVTDDFMADRNEVFGEPGSNLVNRHTFVSDLTLALDSLPDGDIELCDLANEIGRVIANLNSSHKSDLREAIRGLEHGYDSIALKKRY